MRIVQTFCEFPFLESSKNKKENRFSGGWLSKRYHYMSWTLSCLKFREFYDQVELYTNDAGFDLLIEKLGLPYSKVSLSHNNISNVSSLLWAVPKIYTYGLQAEPFIHADGDVFIWKKLSIDIENSPLVTQNFEKNLEFYRPPLEFILKNAKQIPTSINKTISDNAEIISINAGILGGNDIEFIKYYAQVALEFVAANKNSFNNYVNAGTLNIIIEQYLFAQLALQSNKKIEVLFEDVSKDFREILKYHAIPHNAQFLHLIGSAKRDHLGCSQIEFFLKKDFPEYYEKIISLLEEKSSLTRSYQIINPPQFDSTVKVINYFLKNQISADVNIAVIDEKINDVLDLPIGNQVVDIFRELYKLEKIKYFISSCSDVKFYSEQYSYVKFCEAKNLLESNSFDQILSKKYKLGDPYKIELFNYKLPKSVIDDKWIRDILYEINNSSPKQLYYLFTKKETEILITELIYSQKDLCFFKDKELTGEQLAKLYFDNKVALTLNDARNQAYEFISKALTFYGNLQLVL